MDFCKVGYARIDTLSPNCLNACDTPNVFGGAPTGTIMWRSCSSLLPGDRVLVIA